MLVADAVAEAAGFVPPPVALAAVSGSDDPVADERAQISHRRKPDDYADQHDEKKNCGGLGRGRPSGAPISGSGHGTQPHDFGCMNGHICNTIFAGLSFHSSSATKWRYSPPGRLKKKIIGKKAAAAGACSQMDGYPTQWQM
jgi:hypothetical protein